MNDSFIVEGILPNNGTGCGNLTWPENEVNLNIAELEDGLDVISHCACAALTAVQRPLPPPDLAATGAYAAGSFGTGVFSTVPAILLLYFCTETLHMQAAWAAAVVFIPKLWAILWDPLVGVWSDRAATPIGRRRPFLLAGACGVAAAFVAVFSPPRFGEAATVGWMAVTYFLLATVYSLFAVPYVAIPSETTGGAVVRTRLVSWRMVVAMIGVLAGAGLVPHIVEFAGGGRDGYHRMSLLIAGACGVAMLMPLLMLHGRDRPTAGAARARGAVLRQLGSVLRHHAFIRLSGSYVLMLTAVGIISASAPYLITGAFGRPEGDIGTAMIGMLGATTLSMPVWAWAGRKFGTARALMAAVVAFGCGAMLIGGLAVTGTDWVGARFAFAFAGIAFAGMQVLPFTLVAHLVHDAAQSGEAGESSFTGVWTAAEKLGLAFGPALTGIVLALWQGQKIGAVSSLVIAGPAILGLLSLPLLIAATRGPLAGVVSTDP
jgi:GPH family glycoside/pentoside/hexuronide:cation symporter